MAAGELVHPVPAPDPVETASGIEREADDHRVVDRRHGDIVPGEDGQIVFRVVQHFQDRIAFQQRLQRGQRRIARGLFGPVGEHVAAAMAQGDIAGIVRPEREADPDQLRPHRVERARFGVDRHEARFVGAEDPMFESVHGGDRLVGGAVHRGHLGRRLAIARCARFRTLVFGLRGIEIVGPVRAAAARIETAQQAGEAMLFEEGGERFGRHLVQLHVVERDGERAILLQGHENAAEFGIGAMLDQSLLELRFLHVRRRIERGGQRAVVGDQLARGLRTDAEDAGDIVDRVAHQRQHVAQLLGRDAEFLYDLVAPDALRFHRVEHVDAARGNWGTKASGGSGRLALYWS